MEYSISFDSSDSTATLQVSGVLNRAEVMGMVQAFLSDPNWKAGTNVLVDYRKADFSLASEADIQSVSDSIRRFGNTIGDGRVGVVVSRDLDFGMVRMWELMMGDQVPFAVRVFRSKREAQEWLLPGL